MTHYMCLLAVYPLNRVRGGRHFKYGLEKNPFAMRIPSTAPLHRRYMSVRYNYEFLEKLNEATRGTLQAFTDFIIHGLASCGCLAAQRQKERSHHRLPLSGRKCRLSQDTAPCLKALPSARHKGPCLREEAQSFQRAKAPTSVRPLAAVCGMRMISMDDFFVWVRFFTTD